jgi:hypothetical protein
MLKLAINPVISLIITAKHRLIFYKVTFIYKQVKGMYSGLGWCVF